MSLAEAFDLWMEVAQFVRIDGDDIVHELTFCFARKSTFAGAGLSRQDDGSGAIVSIGVRELPICKDDVSENRVVLCGRKTMDFCTHADAPLLPSKYSQTPSEAHCMHA